MAVQHADSRIHRALLRSSPRRLLASAGVLLLAGAGLVGSGANFAATSSNPSSVVTAGVIRQSNSHVNAAVLTAANMAPGTFGMSTVDIGNTGDLPSTDSLTISNVVDTPTASAFAAYLQLKIEDLGSPTCSTGCPAVVTVYNGSLRAAVGTRTLGTFAPATTHRYRFTLTYPNGGANGADNAYGGASVKADMTWGAQQ